MRPARVIPCLLLRGRGLVKGVNFKNHSYVGDPMNAVRIFNEKEADELIFLDINATAEKRIPDIEHVEQIADECYMPFTIGGGVRTTEEIRRLLHAGAEKVAINTSAVSRPELIREASRVFGSQSIVASIDVRRVGQGRYEVYTNNGTVSAGVDAVEHARKVEALGAGEILLTSIDREGTMEGYDLELVRSVSDIVGIPVIAAGGAGKRSDFQAAVKEGHAQAASAGSMFVYIGRRRGVLINYPGREELDEIFQE